MTGQRTWTGADRKLAVLRSNTGEKSPVLCRGHGTKVYDHEDREYLDLFAGAGRSLLGHGNQPTTDSVSEQAARLIVSRHETDTMQKFAGMLADVIPSQFDRVAFFSTGAEAIDIATRITEEATGVPRQAVLDGAFHGRVGAASLLTDPTHLAAPSTNKEKIQRLTFPGDGDTSEVDKVANIAALFYEPLQATAGNRLPFRSHMEQYLRDTRKAGGLIVADEIFTGFGRTGRMFASEAISDGLEPDIMVIGKGMANGLPISALLLKADVLAQTRFAKPGALSSTFGGNPLVLAAACATLKTIQEEGLVRKAVTDGQLWQSLLQKVRGLEVVQDVRVCGEMIGITLLDGVDMKSVSHALEARRLLVGTSGQSLRINPPLTISAEEVAIACERIYEGLYTIQEARCGLTTE